MSGAAFIIGVILLGVLVIGAAFVVAGAVSAPGKDEESSAVLRQPEIKYFNDFEAADYLCISIAELNSMREKGLLKGTFITLRTTDDGSSEQYYDVDSNGNEVVRSRPTRRDTIRCIYSIEALDERMRELLEDGDIIDAR